MTRNQLMRVMVGRMHYRVVIRKRDGTSAEGYFQPPDQEYAYLTPIENRTGEALKVSIGDIESVRVVED